MLLYIILKNNNVDQPGILHSLYFEKKRLTAMITKIKNGSLEFPWNYKKTPQKLIQTNQASSSLPIRFWTDGWYDSNTPF